MTQRPRETTNIVRANYTKVAGHIPARISDVPSWDVETIFLYIIFERSAKLVQE